MKLLGFLNLKGISGQIAALVVTSIIAIHLILTATFLIYRPDQPDPSIDRGHAQLAALVQLLGAAPAAELAWPFEEQLAPPGPVLDPAGTAQANSQRTKNKLIAGGVAVVLLLLVIWGRKVRSKKAKKISDQAKGK